MAYMQKHATRYNIHIINTIMDKYESECVFLVFVYFSAAFDSIDRKRLLEKLKSKGALDGAFLKFVSAMLTRVNATVKGAVLNWFNEVTKAGE